MRYVLITLLLLLIFCITVVKIYDRREKKWYSGGHVEKSKRVDSTSVVCILGCIHRPIENFNADSVFNILQRFQPDIILTETDSAIYNGMLHAYEPLRIPLFSKIMRVFRPRQTDDNETRAVRKYKYQYPATTIFPFDYDGRNEFHTKHQILSIPDTIMNAIKEYAFLEQLTSPQLEIWNYWNHINDTLAVYESEKPFVINQPAVYRLTERRQELQYERINTIIQKNGAFEKYRDFYHVNIDFWHERNRTMSDHILYYIRHNPGKRIMILTGLMHKYYLLNELRDKQGDERFELREYYND